MKQNTRGIALLSLFVILTSSLYAQTVLISSRYNIERICLGEDADKVERYSYHLQDQYNSFNQQKLVNHLNEQYSDNGVFVSREFNKSCGKQILSVIDKELTKQDKKKLSENRQTIFVSLLVDSKGKVLLTEISYRGLLEHYVQPKHIYKILNQIDKMTIKGMRTIR